MASDPNQDNREPANPNNDAYHQSRRDDKDDYADKHGFEKFDREDDDQGT